MPKQTNSQQTNILNFEFLYDHILVEAIDSKSVNGLVKPGQYDDKPEFGKVVKCGNGRLLEDGTVVPLRMKPGDVIYFNKYSSQQVRAEGRDYYIIRDDDAVAVYDEKSRKKV